MNARTRPLRLAAGAVLASLVLSACGQGPVQAGAAAVVGERRIETGTLVGVVERGLDALEEAGGEGTVPDRAELQRGALSRLVLQLVNREAAQRLGVEVSAAEVERVRSSFVERAGGEESLLEQAAAAGIAEPDLEVFLRDVALAEAVADELTQDEQVDRELLRSLYEQQGARYDAVVARHILVEDRATAERLLQQVQADPDSFGELAQENSVDTGSAERGGLLPPAGRGDYVKPFEDALFAAQEGEVGLVQTEFGFHVFELLERRRVPLSEAEPELRRELLGEQRQAARLQLQQEVAEDLGIRVSPRFGTWDLEQLAVVPRDSDLSVPDGADGGLGEPGLLPEGGVEGEPPAEGEPAPTG